MSLIHAGLHVVRGRRRPPRGRDGDGDREHRDDHAVVTPTFYYFSWMDLRVHASREIEPISPWEAATSRRRALGAPRVDPSLRRRVRPDLDEQHRPGSSSLAFPAVRVDDGVDPLRRADRARPALRLPGAGRVPRLRRVDPRRRVGLERRRLPPHAALPGSTTRSHQGVVHGVTDAFALGVLFQPRSAHRQVHEGQGSHSRFQTTQPAHHGARPDADLARASSRCFERVPRDRVDVVPGWATILLVQSFHAPGSITMVDHDGASPAASPAGTFASRGRPVSAPSQAAWRSWMRPAPSAPTVRHPRPSS